MLSREFEPTGRRFDPREDGIGSASLLKRKTEHIHRHSFSAASSCRMAISSSTTAASQSAEAGALPVSPFDLLAIFAAVYLASRLFRALFRTAPPAPTATKPKRN